jgi:hypothetical protein
MKKEIMLNVLRYALGLLMLLNVSSCSEDSIDLNNVLQDESVAAQNVSKNTVSGARIASTNELPLAGGGAYTCTLESVVNNGDGTYTWTWSVLNSSLGNGSGGTFQNLSHWAIKLGTCITIGDVVSGDLSDDGSSWQPFSPTWAPDPSFLNACGVSTGDVLKFNLGTDGTAKSYYRLTINRDVEIDTDVDAHYKSGNNTPCGTFKFPAFGCERTVVDEGCSMSQGFWFSSKNAVWPSAGVTVGGKSYTKAEGLAIWNSSNKGGIADAKQGFLQVSAIKLSGNTVLPAATVLADVTIVENWLVTLPKLTTTNIKNYSNKDASDAAGRIGIWINAHHCE